jgi:aminodeoxyfutalosine synthase
MSIEEIIKKLEDSSERFGVDELHMVGGVNPKLPFEFYTELLRAIKSRFPQVIIKAFTAVEIEHISKIGRKSLKETLVELKYNGLDMLPGGSAEIFSEGVRKRLCPEKISGERWLEIHETAHNLGMPSNATMLFGHIETIEDRVDHIIRLRNAQDRTRGFFSFIPLMFYPQLGYKNLPRPTGLDYLKTLAISRLLLDNIPHVKVYWRMAGLGLSQIGLLSGGDDLDGTIIEERIYESMGAKSPDYLGEDNIRKFIESSGAEPVRRNGLYENTN